MIAPMLYGLLAQNIASQTIERTTENQLRLTMRCFPLFHRIARNTQTVGITSLGLDHTQLLGGTYRDIAWQKSGIIKPGSSVYTTHQNDECLSVLVERAQEKHVRHVSY